MEKWPAKSSARYAKTQNRLSPLWAPSDLGSQKRNAYATFFLTLHSLWAPSDLGPTCLPKISFGAQRVKVCKSAVSRLQKYYNVCNFGNSIATTMGSYGFRGAKVLKVCTKKSGIATTMGSYGFWGSSNDPLGRSAQNVARYVELEIRGGKSAVRYAKQ